MSRLNENQRRFVLAYTANPETMGNATQSAIVAGYSEHTAHTQGPRLLQNLWVKKAISDYYAELEAETGITRARVMAELGRIAFSDIRSVMTWRPTEHMTREPDEEDGTPGIVTMGNMVTLIDINEISDDDAAAIAEISEGQHGVKIKMHGKVAALQELGRHLGITQKVSVTGPNGGPIQTINATMTAVEAAELYARTLNEE